MKNVIFKYELPITDKLISLELPNDCYICDIKNQKDKICIWALIDPDVELEVRKFKIYGTGHKIEDIQNLFYLKTLSMPYGLVWHIFEVINDE